MSLPMLINCRLSSAFFNFLLKFDAIWRMQYTKTRSSPSYPTSSDCNAEIILVPLSVIMHKFGWGVTHCHNNWKNQIKASQVSPSTIANANGNMFRFPSWAVAANNVPWYLPVRNVPSTCTMGLPKLKPSIQGLKDQNMRSNV